MATQDYKHIVVKPPVKRRFDAVMPEDWRSQSGFVNHLLDYYEGKADARTVPGTTASASTESGQ